MSCLVIIPARSGSKRIKNKNIKLFQKKTNHINSNKKIKKNENI